MILRRIRYFRLIKYVKLLYILINFVCNIIFLYCSTTRIRKINIFLPFFISLYSRRIKSTRFGTSFAMFEYSLNPIQQNKFHFFRHFTLVQLLMHYFLRNKVSSDSDCAYNMSFLCEEITMTDRRTVEKLSIYKVPPLLECPCDKSSYNACCSQHHSFIVNFN